MRVVVPQEHNAMNQQQSYIALDWVKEALDETLSQIRHDIEHATHSDALLAVRDALHQVSGTLHMTQLAEPLVLAETLEQLAQSVADGQTPMTILSELGLGVDLLRDELDQLQRTKRGHSVAIYRMIHHFRPLLARDPLRQRDWLKPDLSLIISPNWQPDPLTLEARRFLARAMRHYLQRVLNDCMGHADWNAMASIASHAQNGARTVQQAALWRLAQVVYLELSASADSPTTELRQLLIRLERSLDHDSDDEAILADTLIQLGEREVLHTAAARELRQAFGLDAPVEAGITPRLLESVTQLVKSARLTLQSSLSDSILNLSEAVRLLDVAGWSSLSATAQLALTRLSDRHAISPQQRDDIAVSLDQLVASLQQTTTLMAQDERDSNAINDARHAAVRESRAALESVKDAMSAYNRSHWQAAELEMVPESLHLVRGVFIMLSLSRPATLLEQMAGLITNSVMADAFKPNWRQVDLLADMVSAIEYYLDQLAVHYQDDSILDRVEHALTHFHDAAQQPLPEVAGGQKLYHDATPDDVIDDSKRLATALAADVESNVEPSAVVVATVSKPSVAITPALTLPQDDFDVDDEIREIFIEEIEEVLENIHAEFPKWAADVSNLTALKEFRRGFHTIKGSGRMVGARVVGELAWSVENMLNRVLDQSVQGSDAMAQLITDVLTAVPVMVGNYAVGERSSIDPTPMILRAEALSKGLPPPPDGGSSDEPESPSPLMPSAAETVSPDATDAPVARQNDHLIHDVLITEDTSVATTVASVTTAAVSIDVLSADIKLPSDDFDIDDEIRDIFIEEADEVLESIHASFPTWAADFTDISALKEFRRGFHTLKGSGRMVGARVVGELAWSIENMLNRVLDDSITPDQAMVQLIADVLAIVPVLVGDFAAGQVASLSIKPFVYTALEISAGRTVDVQQQMASSTLEHPDATSALNPIVSTPTTNATMEPLVATEDESDDAFEALAGALNAELDAVDHSDTAPLVINQFEMDPQLLDIFLAEAEGYLADIQAYLIENPQGAEVSDVLLRALHTLRGSAGMSGVDPVYRIAMAMEHECKRLMRDHLSTHSVHLECLSTLSDRVMIHLDVIRQLQPTHLDADDLSLIQRISDLEQGSSESAVEESVSGLVAQLMNLEIDDVLDAEWELENQLADANHLTDYLSRMHQQMQLLHEAVRPMPVRPLIALSEQLTSVYGGLLGQPQDVAQQDDLVELLIKAHASLTRMFDAMAGSQKVPAEQDMIAALAKWRGAPLVDVSPAPVAIAPIDWATEILVPRHHDVLPDTNNDPELLEIFLEEAEEVVREIDEQFDLWAQDAHDTSALSVLQRHLHTLKGGARMARVESLGDLGHELETVYEQLVEGRDQPSTELVRFMRHAQDQVAQQVDQLVRDGTSFFCPDEIATLHAYLKQHDKRVLADFFSTAVDGSTSSVSAPVASSATTSEAVVTVAVATSPSVATTASIPSAPAPLRQMQVLAEAWDEGNAPDPEMLEIFLDEAGEIIDETSMQLATWQKEPSNIRPLTELQRGLHTLKGGARMAGVGAVGDLAHEMEFVYEDLALGKAASAGLIVPLLARCHDWLADAVTVLDRGERPVQPQKLIDALQAYRRSPESLTELPALVLREMPLATVSGVATDLSKDNQGDGTEPPSMHGSFNRQSSEQSANEMIRVSSSLMEKMINLSGESAINRARIEMGTTSLGMTIEEMGATVQRLAEQLRRMEGELEVQILARHEGERDKYQDFDPLEMDQYSSLNQLSKSLAESASDLLDFKATLLDKVRDSESLLLQQSRTQTELQEGLMSSRLVPFSRLVPRLQRVVRQTATELGKPAELTIQNAEGELDRTILERIVAPLEHMLRNAVDHGLETPAERQTSGKVANGHIVLDVAREGGEIVIKLQDDGRGINVDAVRKKAIERGLLEEGAPLSDLEVMQYIFHAGLSTAEKVTQISGRGVGMDVVQSEIKLLGGTVMVSSVRGEGSCFTLRLPLTVAVADALMVRAGDRNFAVPLSQIERIVRVSPDELQKIYKANDERYIYNGQTYRLRYLGELVQGMRVPNLQDQVLSLPLLLVRQGEQYLALHVDQLVGSRSEIVIKPVGQQLALVSGLSGATILGDGSVVIILDVGALARQVGAQKIGHRNNTTESNTANSVQKTVMVVDDSVTVRKVTSRLLERQGFLVVTAKDGVDAIQILEDLTPDIMLLDIEMPRMDGFEVANLVRHNPRLSDLPIIMITSRTGEKHRERAFQIGVNCYMGKPFQEQELLENINELLVAFTNG
jgi:chemosensory pili system protein ChpA (sensor histidine kinase/response regulator)